MLKVVVLYRDMSGEENRAICNVYTVSRLTIRQVRFEPMTPEEFLGYFKKEKLEKKKTDFILYTPPFIFMRVIEDPDLPPVLCLSEDGKGLNQLLPNGKLKPFLPSE